MDSKKKKYNSMDSLQIKNPPKQKIHYIHRNETINTGMSVRNVVDYSIDDGFSSISHSISNPNELNSNKKSPNSDVTSSANSVLNFANQNLTTLEAYSTAQRIKVKICFKKIFSWSKKQNLKYIFINKLTL